MKSTRRRLTVANRQLEIIESAFEEFVKQGLDKTSLRSIARASNINPSLILHHFGGLDKLFLAVVKKAVQDARLSTERYFEGLDQASELLQAYVESMFDWIGLNPKLQILFLQLYHHAVFNDVFNSFNLQVVKMGRERIKKILELGIDQKSFVIDDLDTTTKAIQDLLTGTFFRMAATRTLSNPQRERADLITQVFILVQKQS